MNNRSSLLSWLSLPLLLPLLASSAHAFGTITSVNPCMVLNDGQKEARDCQSTSDKPLTVGERVYTIATDGFGYGWGETYVTPLPAQAGAKSQARAAQPAAAAGLVGVVKSYDARTGRGVLIPAAGGPDVAFAADPKMKSPPKARAKVRYKPVAAVLTAVE